jgi:hypothetical protein
MAESNVFVTFENFQESTGVFPTSSEELFSEFTRGNSRLQNQFVEWLTVRDNSFSKLLQYIDFALEMRIARVRSLLKEYDLEKTPDGLERLIKTAPLKDTLAEELGFLNNLAGQLEHCIKGIEERR